MTHRLKKEKKYSYIEVGEGKPIIVLHGLMGGLSNFDSVTTFFSNNSSNIIIAKNGLGQTWFPALGINQIGNILPGEAILVKTSSAINQPVAMMASISTGSISFVGSNPSLRNNSNLVHYAESKITSGNATVIILKAALLVVTTLPVGL